ncbi:hypothetical protein ACQP0U_24760 [Micromonospora sp. CA-269861]|uniref:hypothetical protein n=1 Tax=Micromonospora sp. CA-269861 TaxID=3239968 RepID=UPI003D90FF36
MLGLAVALAVGGVATPASAESNAPVAKSTVGNGADSGASAQATWHFYAAYPAWTSACTAAGVNGYNRGWWYDFDCVLQRGSDGVLKNFLYIDS